jgi:triosephosphate isomerase
MRTPIVGGNWKMNTTAATARALAGAVADAAENLAPRCQVALFPPFVYLRETAELLRARSSPLLLGAQDVYFEPDGAFTGEVSTNMLKDCGVSIVLAGHSERRHVLGETDEIVNRKTLAVLNAGLSCILCIGETLAQREQGRTDDVNRRQAAAGLRGVSPEQMSRVVIAYEPVWAIGTGRTATPADAQNAHARIRALLSELYGPAIADATRIQYGGSVKGSNAAELCAQPDIDGGLIGGASLKPDEFLAIVRAAAAKR